MALVRGGFPPVATPDHPARPATNSELAAFERCPLSWWVEYHHELRAPDEPGSPAMRGSLVHAMIEAYLDGRRPAHVAEAAEAEHAGADWVGDCIALFGSWETWWRGADLGEGVERVEAAVAVPAGGLTHIDGLAGMIDLVIDTGDGGHAVIDHKTSRQPWTVWWPANRAKVARQLTMYAELAWLAWGYDVRQIGVHHHQFPASDRQRARHTEHRWDLTYAAKQQHRLWLTKALRRLDEAIETAPPLTRPEALSRWARPGDHCRYCDFRSGCWQQMIAPGVPVDLTGLVPRGRTQHHARPLAAP